MRDGNHYVRAGSSSSADIVADEVSAELPENELDGSESMAKHGRLLDWFRQELDKQRSNRIEMATDEDFYDGIQLTESEQLEMEGAGQAPVVYNLVKPAMDWVLGTERRSKMDFNVLPREPGDDESAQIKKKILKYQTDVNSFPWKRSQAFKDAIVAGIGWVETTVRGDATEEPIYMGYENWRNIIWDSNSTTLDLKDARYLFRMKWVDADIAKAMFPERSELIDASRTDKFGSMLLDDDVSFGSDMVAGGDSYLSRISSEFAGQRDRVRLIECWYRVSRQGQIMRHNGRRVKYNDKNQKHVDLVQNNYATIVDGVVQDVRCAILTETGMLADSLSPFNHDRFPLTPIWCFRGGRDSLPYGMVRSIRDPQVGFNKRMSKAHFILSASRVLVEEDAVHQDDHDSVRDEAARPDSYIIMKRGRINDIKLDRENELAQQHVDLAEMDRALIAESSGVTSENRGVETNAVSGKAITARQLQGQIVTAVPFDNLLLADQVAGQITLSLTEQYMDEPRVIRLVGDRQKVDWVRINQIDPITGEKVNDITATQADYVIGESDFRETMRLALADQMMELISKFPPEVSIKLLDIVVGLYDIPDKQEALRRIREINGQPDPDTSNTPEAMAEKVRKQQAAQAQQATQERIANAEANAAEAKVELARAQVTKLLADAGLSDQRSVEQAMAAVYAAMQAAQVATTAPGVASMADSLLESGGFVDQHGQVDIPTLRQPKQQPVVQPIPQPLGPNVGLHAGIQTMDNDGVR